MWTLLPLQFSSVQSLSRIRLLATSWIAARQASMSITNSRSLLKLMSIESVMPCSHLILCRPLLLLPPILPSIRVSCSVILYHDHQHHQVPDVWASLSKVHLFSSLLYSFFYALDLCFILSSPWNVFAWICSSLNFSHLLGHKSNAISSLRAFIMIWH